MSGKCITKQTLTLNIKNIKQTLNPGYGIFSRREINEIWHVAISTLLNRSPPVLLSSLFCSFLAGEISDGREHLADDSDEVMLSPATTSALDMNINMRMLDFEDDSQLANGVSFMIKSFGSEIRKNMLVCMAFLSHPNFCPTTASSLNIDIGL